MLKDDQLVMVVEDGKITYSNKLELLGATFEPLETVIQALKSSKDGTAFFQFQDVIGEDPENKESVVKKFEALAYTSKYFIKEEEKKKKDYKKFFVITTIPIQSQP